MYIASTVTVKDTQAMQGICFNNIIANDLSMIFLWEHVHS